MNSDPANSSEQSKRCQEQAAVPPKSILSPDNDFVTSLRFGFESALASAQEIQSNSPTEKLFSHPLKILVGLSGGPDSTSLLAALVALAQLLPLEINACHINHHQRAQESQLDEDFCRTLCNAWSIPLTVCHLQNMTEMQSEEALRNARIDYLNQTACTSGAIYVVLGHTLDDQIETILFNLFRGSGHIGVMGMKAARQTGNDLFLLRPMLSITKQACLEYLESIKLVSAQDSSNFKLDYNRNYIRHQILPMIVNRFPTAGKQILQFREIISADEEYLTRLAHLALNEIKQSQSNELIWDLQKFNQQELSIKRRLLKLSLQNLGIEASFKKISTVIDHCQNMEKFTYALNSNYELHLEKGFLVWRHKQLKTNFQNLDSWTQQLQIPGVNILSEIGWILKATEITDNNWSPKFPPNYAPEAVVDLRNVSLPLIVRFRQPGDLIQPFGMTQKVKLKKYLHTHKPCIDSSHLGLDNTLLIADQEEVIWVPSIGLSEKVKVLEQPTHHLKLMKLIEDDKNLC